MSTFPVNVGMLPTLEPELIQDIYGLADPFDVNIPIFVTNTEDIDLYLRVYIKNPPSGWVTYSQDLGLIPANSSKDFVLNFQRNKPTLTEGEYSESITLVFEFYTDSEYTNLYTSKEFTLTVLYVDHTDPSWTILDEDNFDLGNNEGFNNRSLDCINNILGVSPHDPSDFKVTDKNYLSAPYSYGYPYCGYRGAYQTRKTYSLPSGIEKAFLTLHYYNGEGYITWIKAVVATPDCSKYKVFFLDKTWRLNAWRRTTLPLFKGEDNVFAFYFWWGSTSSTYLDIYIDDIVVFYK